jgi:long-subunit acyl-CoA synthetase (AMP-forming)
MAEVRPTYFMAVPRLWEKFYEQMEAAGKESTWLNRWISTWAKDVGLRGSYSKMNK